MASVLLIVAIISLTAAGHVDSMGFSGESAQLRAEKHQITAAPCAQGTLTYDIQNGYGPSVGIRLFSNGTGVTDSPIMWNTTESALMWTYPSAPAVVYIGQLSSVSGSNITAKGDARVGQTGATCWKFFVAGLDVTGCNPTCSN